MVHTVPTRGSHELRHRAPKNSDTAAEGVTDDLQAGKVLLDPHHLSYRDSAVIVMPTCIIGELAFRL